MKVTSIVTKIVGDSDPAFVAIEVAFCFSDDFYLLRSKLENIPMKIAADICKALQSLVIGEIAPPKGVAISDMITQDCSDPVNHPSHYTFGKFEVADVLDDWFKDEPLLWQNGKYTARAKHKGNFLQDLKKARWYLDRRIKAEEAKEEAAAKEVEQQAVVAREALKGLQEDALGFGISDGAGRWWVNHQNTWSNFTNEASQFSEAGARAYIETHKPIPWIDARHAGCVARPAKLPMGSQEDVVTSSEGKPVYLIHCEDTNRYYNVDAQLWCPRTKEASWWRTRYLALDMARRSLPGKARFIIVKMTESQVSL